MTNGDPKLLLIASIDDPKLSVDVFSKKTFVAMLPAFLPQDFGALRKTVVSWLDIGCVEICCIGPMAEELHDSIDEVIEDQGAFHIVTTWHRDLDEGCDYFLHAAGGGGHQLLGLVGKSPGIVAKLEQRAHTEVSIIYN